jgi:hypothetical protein
MAEMMMAPGGSEVFQPASCNIRMMVRLSIVWMMWTQRQPVKKSR